MRLLGRFRLSRKAIEEFRADGVLAYTANFNVIRPTITVPDVALGGQLVVHLTKEQYDQLSTEGEYLFEIQLTKKES